jgi:glutathione S-transferase
MLELIIYPKPPVKQLINNSPFCAKSEVYIKLTKLDFKIQEFNGDPAKFKKGKLPVLKDGDQYICDSALIQRHIENKYNINLNPGLSEDDKALGFAFSKMTEEFFYWSLLHERWFIDSNWKVLVDRYFNNIPKLIRGFITNSIRKNAKKGAIGHGMSRHSDEEIFMFGCECLKTLSTFLKSKKYLLGDTTSSYDSTFYAFVANSIHSDLSPKLQKEALKYKNLVDYDQRMFELLYKS